jgi:hypothetical protein
MQGGRTWWERDEMRREGACEVGGNWDATWEARRQSSVFMLTRSKGGSFGGDEAYFALQS